MQFNDLKFELLRYGKDEELKLSTSYISPSFNLIEEKSNVKDLGVTLSADATFKTHINNIVESAKNMASWILRTFQARGIRNITNTTVDKFKRKLDTFLNTIDDHPHLRSGQNQGSYSSNHLYDCITLNNSEQSTPGVLNYSPLGNLILSRGLASSETVTLMQ